MGAVGPWVFAQRLARGVWIRLPKVLRRAVVRVVEPKFLVGVVVVAVAADGKVLCVRHVFRPRAYPWGLPAGFLKRGELPQAAALREILEETGYEAEFDALLGTSLARPDQLELLVRVRLGRKLGIGGFEATDSGLYSANALPSGFLPSNLQVLRLHGFPDAAEKPP